MDLVCKRAAGKGTRCRSAYPEDHSSSAGAGFTSSSETSSVSTRRSNEHLSVSIARLSCRSLASWLPVSGAARVDAETGQWRDSWLSGRISEVRVTLASASLLTIFESRCLDIALICGIALSEG